MKASRCFRWDLVVAFGFMTLVRPAAVLPAAPPNCLPVQVEYRRDCGVLSDQQGGRLLESGECAEMRIDARSRWNASGILVEEGAVYQIEVGVPALSQAEAKALKDQCGLDVEATEFGAVQHQMVWCDAYVQATPEGWCQPGNAEHHPPAHEAGCDAPAGLVGWGIAQLAAFRRYKDPTGSPDGLFHLVGAVASTSPPGRLAQFAIGTGTTRTLEMTGEFCSFANDLPLMYGNNFGFLKLRIRRQ